MVRVVRIFEVHIVVLTISISVAEIQRGKNEKEMGGKKRWNRFSKFSLASESTFDAEHFLMQINDGVSSGWGGGGDEGKSVVFFWLERRNEEERSFKLRE